jgi:hypothetical protein
MFSDNAIQVKENSLTHPFELREMKRPDFEDSLKVSLPCTLSVHGRSLKVMMVVRHTLDDASITSILLTGNNDDNAYNIDSDVYNGWLLRVVPADSFYFIDDAGYPVPPSLLKISDTDATTTRSFTSNMADVLKYLAAGRSLRPIAKWSNAYLKIPDG